MNIEKIKVIAFDADDTLWDCQGYFEEVEEHLYSLIAPYCENPKQELFKTESGNMADLGYGCKAFTISILETAMRIAGNDLSVTQLDELLQDCKCLLHLPATPLSGVEETLRKLREKMEDSLFYQRRVAGPREQVEALRTIEVFRRCRDHF